MKEILIRSNDSEPWRPFSSQEEKEYTQTKMEENELVVDKANKSRKLSTRLKSFVMFSLMKLQYKFSKIKEPKQY